MTCREGVSLCILTNGCEPYNSEIFDMSSTLPTLHLFCGKIASGKSTLARHLGKLKQTVIIAEDDWLNILYADEISSMSVYVESMAKLRKIIGPHVVSLLNSGVSVVLDFQANTIESRKWMRKILNQANAAHKLHVMDVSDEVCIARLHARNQQGDHPFAATEDQFGRITKHFVLPSSEEGFDIALYGSGNAA